MAVIEDSIRSEAAYVIQDLRTLGFKRVVMLTGDDERTAKAVARAVGITEYHSHVLPTEKGKIIQRLNSEGCQVMMIGDGINDGPALSAASVGVAMGDGTDLARAVSNVLLTKPKLNGLTTARMLGTASLKRIHNNAYAGIMLNSIYLLGGIFGLFTPALTATLHNLTTIGIALNAIRPYQIKSV